MSELKSLYERIGGEDGVRQLVERFYGHMDTNPDVAQIRAMHPANLQSSIDKLFEFLSGWLGGPQLYVQKRGHPRLRMRHAPFPINSAAAGQWMVCMEYALAESALDPLGRQSLVQRFTQVADFMRNQPDADPGRPGKTSHP